MTRGRHRVQGRPRLAPAPTGREARLDAPLPARIARQLALAHALRRRLERGEFTDFADMARQLGFTRAGVTQLMDLLLLAPEV